MVIKGHLTVYHLIAPDFNPGLQMNNHYRSSPKAGAKEQAIIAHLNSKIVIPHS